MKSIDGSPTGICTSAAHSPRCSDSARFCSSAPAFRSPTFRICSAKCWRFTGPARVHTMPLISEGEVDADFMLARFHIIVVPYPEENHRKLVDWLSELADQAERPRRTQVAWSWGRVEPKGPFRTSIADVEIVRDELPATRASAARGATLSGGECDI